MDKEKIKAQIDPMTLEQARKELASGTFGDPTTIVHNFASQLVSLKESEERDKRDAETLSLSRKALSVSRDAKVIAIISIVLSTIIAISAIIVTLLVEK